MEYFSQNGLYERHIRPVLCLSTWLAFLDLDEFMYGRKETIAEYLRRVPQDIGRLEVGCVFAHPKGFVELPVDACFGTLLCSTFGVTSLVCLCWFSWNEGCIACQTA